MKPSLNLVQFNNLPILTQLKWEEALLRTDHRNWCLINQGSSPAIVMGISGIVQQLIDLDYLAKAPLPLIRRFSGGGTVVVDPNTFFVTFICQSEALPIPSFPRPIMEWTAQIYKPLFDGHHFQLQENDYAVGERKWGGNAQSIIKGRWLHHSSLLWNYNSQLMKYLLMPAKMPAYRQNRSHDDFLCCLSDYWESKETFQNQFIEQLAQIFNINKMGHEEIEVIASAPHRRVTSLIEPPCPCPCPCPIVTSL